ncbi:MAG: bifunctional UDP-sugar hydrolase/5'-nucleotidase [Nitrospirales bacterium]|nr:bifunctional metallophosphatase/5'-nucleotidase [Nitrospirales bacterium]
MRKIKDWGISWCVALLVGQCPVLAAETLIILHSSEHHGVALPLERPGDSLVGGLSRRATLIDEVRREGHPVLVVDSGDILIGTAFSSWFKGEPDILAMNRMGYAGMVAGNHDFDFGVDHLTTLTQLATFPLLCTNLVSKDRPLPCQPSAMVSIGGWRIGLLGIVGRSNFPDTFSREAVKSLTLEDSVPVIQREANALREEHLIDLMVLLTHQDTEEDLDLLVRSVGIDVIIGGHTEGFDGLYAVGTPQPVSSLKFPGPVFVKTHRQGRFLGRLDLTSEFRTVTHAHAENIPVTESIPVHAGVQSVLDTFRERFSEQASEVVGQTRVRLNGERPSVRTQETNLGNLLADLLRIKLRTDVALVNGGQIRRSIDAGPVTLGDVVSVLPFDSSLVTLRLTGQVLLQVLEHSVSQWPNHSGRFLQVSGIRVTYDMSAPVGSRVRNVLIKERPLDPEEVYSVAADAFIADGGDGFVMLGQARERTDHQTPIRDVLFRALEKEPIQADLDGRITILPSATS